MVVWWFELWCGVRVVTVNRQALLEPHHDITIQTIEFIIGERSYYHVLTTISHGDVGKICPPYLSFNQWPETWKTQELCKLNRVPINGGNSFPIYWFILIEKYSISCKAHTLLLTLVLGIMLCVILNIQTLFSMNIACWRQYWLDPGRTQREVSGRVYNLLSLFCHDPC